MLCVYDYKYREARDLMQRVITINYVNLTLSILIDLKLS